MKIIKGLAIFALLNVFLGCFDPPEFEPTPLIDFIRLEFVEVGGFGDPDSLNLFIDFRDGDGDLGLYPNDPNHISDPYNDINYFLADNSGDLKVAPTWRLYTNLPNIIKLDQGTSGKLATSRTRDNPLYSYLPAFSTDSCYYYRYFHESTLDTAYYAYDTVYVESINENIIDNSYNIIDTLISTQGQPNIYVLLDTFYFEPNPYHNNITVDFLVKEIVGNNVVWKQFDWVEFNCDLNGLPGTSFDARFPVLTDNSRTVEGTLKYAMKSTGFLALFSIKTLKLRVTIRDRALRKSNTIETPEFTLSEIKKG